MLLDLQATQQFKPARSCICAAGSSFFSSDGGDSEDASGSEPSSEDEEGAAAGTAAQRRSSAWEVHTATDSDDEELGERQVRWMIYDHVFVTLGTAVLATAARVRLYHMYREVEANAEYYRLNVVRPCRRLRPASTRLMALRWTTSSAARVSRSRLQP